LVYLPGPEYFPNQTVLAWIDRSGRQEEISLPAGDYSQPRISPDGEFLALTSRQADGSSDIWVYDFSTGSFGPRTFSGNALDPIWTADGSRLFYQKYSVMDAGGNPRGELWVMNADGTGQAERILDAVVRIDSFSQSDEKLIYTSYGSDGTGNRGQLNTLTFRDDVWVSAPLLHTDFNTDNATVSPDGRWIAYQSNESGTPQVYVRPYPNLDAGKWGISSGERANLHPVWGPNSDELLFLGIDGSQINLMHADITIEGDSFSTGIVEPLLTDLKIEFNLRAPQNYFIPKVGERLLFVLSQATTDAPDMEFDQNRTELVMVENFFEELRRLAPPYSQ